MTQIILTIIVPAYNEKKSISRIIDQINEKIIYTKQIIVIDDFSNDGTKDVIQNLSNIDKIDFNGLPQFKSNSPHFIDFFH